MSRKRPVIEEPEDKEGKPLAGLARPAIVVIIFVVLAAFFVTTGADPLGIFEQQLQQAANSATGAESPVPPELPLALPPEFPPELPPELPDNSGSSQWWLTMFTDPSAGQSSDDLTGTIPEQLIYRINGAQVSIHIAAFEFDLRPVAEALLAASRQGVEVRWITDDEYGIEVDDEEGRLFPLMENAAVEVRADDRVALMHNKFVIFDRQAVWTGSTNLTENGNFRNNNNVLVIESPEVAAIYEREFEELWRGESGPRSPSTVDEQAVTVKSTPVQVLFAAEDEVMSHLVSLVDGAQESIRFMAFSFTHDELAAAMLDRAEAGLDVKGIFETRGSETPYSELYSLACAGLQVRQDGNPRTMHHKVLLIDDRTVVTGSFNFSDNADQSNDENVVILKNSVIARQYLREFERLWAEAKPPDDADLPCR